MTCPERRKLTFGFPTIARGNRGNDPQEEVAFAGLGRCGVRPEGHSGRHSGHRISLMAWTIELPGASNRVVEMDCEAFLCGAKDRSEHLTYVLITWN